MKPAYRQFHRPVLRADPLGSLAVALYQHHTHILGHAGPAAGEPTGITDQPRWFLVVINGRIERPFFTQASLGAMIYPAYCRTWLGYTGIGLEIYDAMRAQPILSGRAQMRFCSRS